VQERATEEPAASLARKTAPSQASTFLLHTPRAFSQPSYHTIEQSTNTTQSQAIIAGPQVFVSGQIPADKTGALIEGSITDKTTQCCENIVAILKEANTPVEKVVKVGHGIDGSQ
jgi:enamine deaminase RidA (YjgF/YER057c/UK114 family)